MKSLIFILITVVYIPSAFAGDGVRGGGDVVKCTKSSNNAFYGIYPLGYLQVKLTNQNEDPPLLASKKSCDKVLDELQTNLKEQVPHLAAGFEDYVKHFAKKTSKKENIGLHRIWNTCEKQGCLNNYKDEGIHGHLVVKLPSNCKIRDQYALRKEKQVNGVRYVTYYLNKKAHADLKGPMCAFNMVHEWLRDFISESDELYQASYEVFQPDLKKRIEAKEGLFQYIPKRALASKEQASLKNYAVLLSPAAEECQGEKGKYVCSFKYFKLGSSFGFVVDQKDKKSKVCIPRNGKKLETKWVKTSEIEKIELAEVHPGFIGYLRSLPMKELNQIHKK